MGHPPSPCPLRAGARERGSVDTGASWAGYLVFPSISVPPTLTCIGVWVDHLGLPHGRIGVFHLEYFFRNEPCLHWEIWSDPYRLCSYSATLTYHRAHLPPSSHVGFFLYPASRSLLFLSSARNILLQLFHVWPILILRVSAQKPSPPRSPPCYSNPCNLYDSVLGATPPGAL